LIDSQLSEGDIVFFEMGEKGARQLYNHTEQPCRFLDMQTNNGIDVCEYPDSEKINNSFCFEIAAGPECRTCFASLRPVQCSQITPSEMCKFNEKARREKDAPAFFL
jgi:hypothetical protein